MSSAILSRSFTSLGFIGLFGVSLIACQNKIGDRCDTPRDCGVQLNQLDRTCDMSNATLNPSGDGECTVENCSRGSCPEQRPNAICIKTYPTEFLSKACDPEREDIALDDLPPLNDCDAHEVCLPEGLCADELTARTSCRLRCKSDADCRKARDGRDNYECIETGVDGIYRAPHPDNPRKISSVKFCAPPSY